MSMHVLLAEDYNIVRNGIKLLLEAENNFVVQDDILSEKQILEKVNQNEIDLVILNSETTVLDGLGLTRRIKEFNPAVKVMFLTTLGERDDVVGAFTAGVDGYVLKNAKPDELIFAMKYVKDGGRYLCADLSMKFFNQQLQNIDIQNGAKVLARDFSSREIEILKLIADGLTNSEMSDKLFISKRTIEGHRQSLLEKTGSKNTASLIRFAIRNQIIH